MDDASELEEDVCRVCRSSAEPEHPLFHPCKCAGSIRWVHQDCLMQWLQASRKRYCETCGASYTFEKVYDPNMPDHLPLPILVLRSIQTALRAAGLVLRAALVAAVWLVIVPWMSIWTLRFYLMLGNNVAWTLAGRASLLPSDANFNGTVPTPSSSDDIPPADAIPTTAPSDTLRSPITSLLWRIVERDIFPGQKLVAAIVFVFLSAFLLREWTLHQVLPDPPADARGPAARAAAAAAAGVDAQEGAVAGDRAAAAAAVAALDAEDAAEDERARRARVEGEGVLAGETDGQLVAELDDGGAEWEDADDDDVGDDGDEPLLERADDDGDVDDTGSDGSLESAVNARAVGEEDIALLRARRERFFQQAQRPGSETEVTEGSLREDGDVREQEKGSTSPLGDEGAAISSSGAGPPSSVLDTRIWPSTVAAESSAAAAAAVDTDGPSNTFSLPPTSILGEGSAPHPPLSAAPSDDTTPQPNTNLDPVGDRIAALERMGDGLAGELEARRANEALQEATLAEPAVKAQLAAGALGPAPTAPREQGGPPDLPADEEEDDTPLDEAEDEDGSDWEDIDEDGNRFVHDAPQPGRANPPPLVPLGFVPAQEAIGPAPLPPMDDLDLDNPENARMLQEEFEGLLEAVGLRGPIIGLLQNSTIITVIVSFFCALAIFIPFVMGKTVLLVNFLAVGRLLLWPIQAVRFVTDPALALLEQTLLHAKLVDVESVVLTSNATQIDSPSLLDSVQKRLLDLTWAVDLPAYLATFEPSAATVERVSSTTAGAFFAVVGRVCRESWASARGLPAWWARTEDLGFFSVASGDSTKDHAVAMAVGYLVLAFGLRCLFLHRGRWATVIRAEIEPTVTVVKLGLFMFIELVVFPFFCGGLLHICLLPALSSKLDLSDLKIIGAHPFVSIGQHVLAGTIFMFGFANVLAYGRTKLRPGVFFFIRDPSDPAFNPVNEILSKRTLAQLKKLLISAAMYATMLVTCVGLVTLIIRKSTSLFPLRLYSFQPLSEVPLDLIVLQFILPVLVGRHQPHVLLQRALIALLARSVVALRLSSYFFDPPSEEGAVPHDETDRKDTGVKRALDWAVQVMGWVGRKDFMAGVGGWARVPSQDHLSILPARRMFVRLNESMAPLDEEELKLLVEINKKAVDNGRNPAEDFGVVWLPGNVRKRVYLLLGVLWTSCFATATSVISLLFVGRLLMRLVVKNDVHDGYALIAGSLLVSCIFEVYGLMQLLRGEGTKAYHPKPYRRRKIVSPWRRRLSRVAVAIYGLVTLALGLPLVLGALVETYLLLPFRSSEAVVPVVHVAEVWALGVLVIAIACRRRDDFDHQVLIELNLAYGHRRWTWDIRRLTRHLLAPVGGGVAAAVVLPWVGLLPLGLLSRNVERNARASQFVHPALLVLVLAYFAGRRAWLAFQSWSTRVREREYLVSLRLRNQGPGGGEDEEADGPAAQMPVPADMIGLLI